MRYRIVGLALAIAWPSGSAHRLNTHDLVFLTRDGCVNTTRVRANLDQALKAMALPADYTVIYLDKLQASDLRTGYGTPTVLYKNRDLFGLAVPIKAAEPS